MQEKRKFLLSIISLFGITAIFWTIWFCRAFMWAEYHDTLATFLGTVLIAIATVMVVDVYLIFRLARPSYMLIKRKREMAIAIVCIAFIMMLNLGMLHSFRDYGYTISTITTIERKESEGGKYYFQIIDSEDGSIVTFECENDIYETLQVEESTSYTIQYRKLTFGNHKAVLGYISLFSEAEQQE